MSIFDKAQELAEEIRNSDELRTVRETELRVMIDLGARQIIEEYQQIQMDAINAGISYDDLAEDKKARLTELEGQMQENTIINEYMTANQSFNQILETVNMIISSALNENQGGGCSSCSSAGDCGENDCCTSCGH